MIKLNFTFLLIVASLITVVSADCSKEEITKLKNKIFSAKEIKSICGESKPEPIDIKWINLSKETCIAYGGEIYYDTCLANWSSANEICSAAGGRLASRLELKSSIIKCGGMIDEYNENTKSASYQACYQKDGFSSVYDYWSSTSCRTNKQDAWVAYMGSGNVYNYDKKGKSYVRCVKDEQ